MLSIGKLQHRVEVQALNAHPTADDHGNPIEEWITEGQVWAEIKPQSGSESQIGDRVTAQTTHSIKIRYRRDMHAGKRLRYGERLFDVNGVADIDEQNRVMVLACKELPSVAK